jgi:hypothetical protein
MSFDVIAPTGVRQKMLMDALARAGATDEASAVPLAALKLPGALSGWGATASTLTLSGVAYGETPTLASVQIAPWSQGANWYLIQ